MFILCLATLTTAIASSGVDLAEIANLHAQIAEVVKSNNRLMSNSKGQSSRRERNELKPPQLVDRLDDEEMTRLSQNQAPVERSLIDRKGDDDRSVKRLIERAELKLEDSGVQELRESNLDNFSLKERKLSEKGLKKKIGADEIVVRFEQIPKEKSSKLTEFTKGKKAVTKKSKERQLMDYTRSVPLSRDRYLKPVPPKVY